MAGTNTNKIKIVQDLEMFHAQPNRSSALGFLFFNVYYS